MSYPTIDRQTSRQLDRRAMEECHIAGVVLMENAGRGVVDHLERFGIRGPVVVCCGKGNNAGDGFVIARHLDLRGYRVATAIFAAPEELAGDAAVNFAILQTTGVPIACFNGPYDPAQLAGILDGADWIVDALLGTGVRGEPRPPLDQVIDQINAASARRLAVDLPSGLDCDTGAAARHTIRAECTCTFVARKPGFLAAGAAVYTGEVHVLDIGAPRCLVEAALKLPPGAGCSTGRSGQSERRR
jgi:NAD(P)H-hydrate epimerase